MSMDYIVYNFQPKLKYLFYFFAQITNSFEEKALKIV